MEKFEKVGQKINDSGKLLQIGSDGPNVNLKFLKMYDEKHSFDKYPDILNIGTCGLHTIHGSLKNAIKASNWMAGKILKSMHYNTPARRETFEKITETNVYPLPYCSHRWCKNEDCFDRADVIWLSLSKFIKYLKLLPKSKQPAGKSYPILVKAINRR